MEDQEEEHSGAKDQRLQEIPSFQQLEIHTSKLNVSFTTNLRRNYNPQKSQADLTNTNFV